jgi:RNA polymerase subunit RPABC4/transcription elongation factor Spt4
LDAGERTSNKTARIIYLLLVVFFNVFGWIMYLILRPSQTIEQIYWADLERRYLKYETSELGDCVKCGTQLYPGYTFCPTCGSDIKIKCKSCDVYIEKNSEYCPYCGTKTVNEVLVSEDIAPSREVMEQQIQASKDEATKVVEAEQTRYSTKKRSLTVKVGSSIIAGYQILVGKVKGAVTPLKEKQKETPVQVSAKKNKKKKKNKKH